MKNKETFRKLHKPWMLKPSVFDDWVVIPRGQISTL